MDIFPPGTTGVRTLWLPRDMRFWIREELGYWGVYWLDQKIGLSISQIKALESAEWYKNFLERRVKP